MATNEEIVLAAVRVANRIRARRGKKPIRVPKPGLIKLALAAAKRLLGVK